MVKFQFDTHMDSFLQFWEYIRESLKLVFHLDQIRYFLSFQTSFYGKSKFQSLSGKYTRYLILEVLNNFDNSYIDIAPYFLSEFLKIVSLPERKAARFSIGWQ